MHFATCALKISRKGLQKKVKVTDIVLRFYQLLGRGKAANYRLLMRRQPHSPVDVNRIPFYNFYLRISLSFIPKLGPKVKLSVSVGFKAGFF